MERKREMSCREVRKEGRRKEIMRRVFLEPLIIYLRNMNRNGKDTLSLSLLDSGLGVEIPVTTTTFPSRLCKSPFSGSKRDMACVRRSGIVSP